MENVTRDLKDQSRDHCTRRTTPRPDRSEIVDVLCQYGPPEGFSLEWVMDRFEQNIGGQS
jgi:hypothetical protein